MAAGIKSKEILDELESHLRDDFDEQLHSGLGGQEAFDGAVLRIGKVGDLKAEFSKLGPDGPSLKRRVLRLFCFGVAPLMFLIEAWTFVQYEMNSLERILGISLAFCVAAYVAGLPRWHRFLSALQRPRFGAAFKAMAFLLALWPVLALLGALNVIHFEMGITFSMITWSLLPAFLATAFACDLLDEPGPLFPPLTDFSPVAQLALAGAREEALHLNHDFIGTEHLLLGLMRSEHDIVPKVLKRMGVTQDVLRKEIADLVGPGAVPQTNPSLPYTPRAKKALALAAGESRAMNHQRVGSGAIFLGLLLEGSGVAGMALKKLGVNAEASRKAILKELGR